LSTSPTEAAELMILPVQIRAARALLGINQSELADMAEISPGTVKRIEASAGNMKVLLETVVRIQQALEAEGIVFIETDEMVGVALRSKS